MTHGRSDDEIIRGTRNTARYFTENRQIAWVLLAATFLWGLYAYRTMPKRKDPEVPVRVAVALCPWPGASADKIEQLVTRRIEEKIAENATVEKIQSISRGSVSVVYVELEERLPDPAKEFDDIQTKIDAIRDLPAGAGPIEFIKDFGDTAALMLTVASPRASEVEISIRARDVKRAIERARASSPPEFSSGRATFLSCLPADIDPRTLQRRIDLMLRYIKERNFVRDPRPIQGPGFIGIDAQSDHDDATILAFTDSFVRERLRASEFHPDLWPPTVIRDPAETEKRLAAVAGERYSYHELDEITDLVKRTLQAVPEVSKVTRSGVLRQAIYLEYSQERLASYGVRPYRLSEILGARNIILPGGLLEVDGKSLTIDPSGEFLGEKEIGDVVITTTESGVPVYLRDLVEITREYESPPRFLNFYTWRDAKGEWRRSRAITLAVQMRPGQQIARFGRMVDRALRTLKKNLPEDLILARTSDQPLQVKENVDLFMRSLYEAIILVVLVAFVGFWEWRSALLMALSIPLTLAMTYGFMRALGIDLQQVSIGSLILALGLLVDDPVVAGDSIKRELAAGHKPLIASWLGPTKLASAILFATITNIVAYLPLLTLSGDVGRFLFSLPVVIGCALVASRIVSMTFIPLLGYYLLRARPETDVPEREPGRRGFAGLYYKVGQFALDHRWAFFAGSLIFLAIGGFFMSGLGTQFFPKDLSYLSYVDVWLPEDAPLAATNGTARTAEAVIRQTAEEYGRSHPGGSGRPREILESLTTFAGGGGPRFWFSVSPEQRQLNYAQIVVQLKDNHDTRRFVPVLQRALTAAVPGARADVRELETGKPVGFPISIRISGFEIAELRRRAEEVKGILRAIPEAERVRDDWGEESFVVKLQVDPDRANMAGLSNLDVALSSATGMSGFTVTNLREGNEMIPVIARLRAEERAQLADVQSLYVYSVSGTQKVPLRQVSSVEYRMEIAKIRRRNQFRTVTVSCFPASGVLPSEVVAKAMPALEKFSASLSPGYRMAIGGEQEEQDKGFSELALVMAISIAAIYMALVVQFRNAFKPIIVFAAIPYGIVGALGALWIVGAPFGFMAFLGVASLIGVIVSHVIVLFDFIEHAQARGMPLREALLDAGIVRLRPVMITVGATVFALFPLYAHGGPLWQPLCSAQIGGLTVATFVTLLLVPVIYTIFVVDLKLVRWGPGRQDSHPRAARIE